MLNMLVRRSWFALHRALCSLRFVVPCLLYAQSRHPLCMFHFWNLLVLVPIGTGHTARWHASCVIRACFVTCMLIGMSQRPIDIGFLVLLMVLHWLNTLSAAFVATRIHLDSSSLLEANQELVELRTLTSCHDPHAPTSCVHHRGGCVH